MGMDLSDDMHFALIENDRTIVIGQTGWEIGNEFATGDAFDKH